MITWIDIETTGLDERFTSAILEVVLVVTDDDLNEIASKVLVVWNEGDVSQLMDPYVLQMHTKNGLLREIERVATDAAHACDIERKLIEWLFTCAALVEPKKETKTDGLVLETPPLIKSVRDYGQVPLAGSTVGFDRRWLRHHMPRLESMFSYRSIDVSTITELARRRAPEIYEKRPKTGEEHRALPDVRGSIEVLRYYFATGFICSVREKPPETTAPPPLEGFSS